MTRGIRARHDEPLAQVAAASQQNGLGATLFRQLRDRLMGGSEPPTWVVSASHGGAEPSR